VGGGGNFGGTAQINGGRSRRGRAMLGGRETAVRLKLIKGKPAGDLALIVCTICNGLVNKRSYLATTFKEKRSPATAN